MNHSWTIRFNPALRDSRRNTITYDVDIERISRASGISANALQMHEALVAESQCRAGQDGKSRASEASL